MEFLAEYGVFLLKVATIVVAILVIVGGIVALSSRPKRRDDGELVVKKLNDELEDHKLDLEYAIFNDYELKMLEKERKKEEKAKDKAEKKLAKEKAKEAKLEALQTDTESEPETEKDVSADQIDDEGERACGDDSHEQTRKRVFVVDFDGDIQASQVELMRHEITAILTMATPQDEVVVRLESGGGMVHSYGFAASQLERIRQKNIPLTVCVDHVAASGGYMMACLADRIIAAPFALVGSIGVVAQLPNFNKVLKKYDVDYELYTAGEYKRTVTMFGENTAKAKEKFQSDLEDTHDLFKQHVQQYRPNVDIEVVATGDVWYGQQALKNGLIDEIGTSDDYLVAACEKADVFSVQYEYRKTLQEKLGFAIQQGTEKAVLRLMTMVSRQQHSKS